MWPLHVLDNNVSDKPAIVFLHGFPFNHSMWDAQIQLLGRRFRTLAYDQRGHGQSDVGTGHYALELLVDDLLELLDAKKITKAVLCGLSMGGYVALRAMERAPERFSGLILADTRSESDSNETRIKRSGSLKTIQEQGVSTFCEGFLKAIFAPESLIHKPEVVDQVRNMIMGNSPIGIMGMIMALAGRTDTTASLDKIKVPTLILVGEKDAVTPPEAAQAMYDKIHGATWVKIPNAGHMSNLENPDAFNAALEKFIKTIIPA